MNNPATILLSADTGMEVVMAFCKPALHFARARAASCCMCSCKRNYRNTRFTGSSSLVTDAIVSSRTQQQQSGELSSQ